jgi:hypothetical protein
MLSILGPVRTAYTRARAHVDREPRRKEYLRGFADGLEVPRPGGPRKEQLRASYRDGFNDGQDEAHGVLEAADRRVALAVEHEEKALQQYLDAQALLDEAGA